MYTNFASFVQSTYTYVLGLTVQRILPGTWTTTASENR